MSLTQIEEKSKAVSLARKTLTERVTALEVELNGIRTRKVPGIKSAVAAVKEAESVPEAELIKSRHLFTEIRTIVVNGLRVGFQKGRGKIEWADEASVIGKIEKLLPEQAELLIKIEKSIRKKAINALDIAELKKLGCTVTAAGDHVYIAPVDDNVDKLVKRLLDEGNEE